MGLLLLLGVWDFGSDIACLVGRDDDWLGVALGRVAGALVWDSSVDCHMLCLGDMDSIVDRSWVGAVLLGVDDRGLVHSLRNCLRVGLLLSLVVGGVLCFASRRRCTFGLQLLAPAVVLVPPTTITRQCSDNAAGGERCHNCCSQMHFGKTVICSNIIVETSWKDQEKAKGEIARTLVLSH